MVSKQQGPEKRQPGSAGSGVGACCILVQLNCCAGRRKEERKTDSVDFQ